MSKQDNLKDYLVDFANTIRIKKGYPSSQKINPQSFSDEVMGIDSGKPTLFPAVITGGYNQISWITDPRNGSFDVTTTAKLDGIDIIGNSLIITQDYAGKHLVITSSADNFKDAVVDILVYYMSAQSSLISISEGDATSDYGLCVEISDTDILVPQGYESNVGNKYYSYKTTTDSDGQASDSLSFSIAALSDERPETFKVSVVNADNETENATVAWTITKNGETVYTGTTTEAKAEISIPNDVTWEQGDDIEFIVNATIVALPSAEKGDILYIDMDGDGNNEQYRVIKVNYAVAELVSLNNINKIAFGANNVYENSILDEYLNTTFYNSLSINAKNAIVDKMIQQDCWKSDASGNPTYTGYYGNQKPGEARYNVSLKTDSYGDEILRHIYALSVQDILDYILDTNITDGQIQNYNIWKMLWNDEVSHSTEIIALRSAEFGNENLYRIVMGANGSLLNNSWASSINGVRCAFQIDLTKIKWSK